MEILSFHSSLILTFQIRLSDFHQQKWEPGHVCISRITCSVFSYLSLVINDFIFRIHKAHHFSQLWSCVVEIILQLPDSSLELKAWKCGLQKLYKFRMWWVQEKEYSQSDTSQAKGCQLHPAGRPHKRLTVQRLAGIQALSYTSGKGKADFQHFMPGTGRQKPRKISISLEASHKSDFWLRFFVSGPEDSN